MADISVVRIPKGTYHNIKDSRIPDLPESENVYMRGDGTWSIPVSSPSSGIVFVDGGDHLLVLKG